MSKPGHQVLYAGYIRQNKVEVRFPYNEELIALVKQIPGRRWYPNDKVWRCPLRSLPEVLELFEPRGFLIAEELREKLPEIRREREKVEQQRLEEQRASEQFQQRLEAGEEAAFVPSGNSTLTRKLKAISAYEVIKEQGYYGQQVAGIRVLEADLVEVLTELGAATDLESRLCELLYYTWKINTEAYTQKKRQKRSTSQYRYLKKGYLLDELCRLAAKQTTYTWGWKEDPDPPPHAEWVLYFERDGIQCSFHSLSGRSEGPTFPGEWDGKHHDSFPFAQYAPAEEDRIFALER